MLEVRASADPEDIVVVCAGNDVKLFWFVRGFKEPASERDGDNAVPIAVEEERRNADGADFFATLFARTQPGRAGMENYPQARHPQPLFPVGRRPQNRFSISIYEMGAA